jgi:glycosyltransferase involved in cell wall biosynthesis
MSALAARRHGKPVLLSQNVGFIQYRSAALNLLQRVAYRTVGRWVLAHADHVVLASAGAETFIPTAARLQEEQISRVPVGIDTTRFRPSSPAERRAARATLGLPDAPPIVFFAGRLVEKKGLPLVLEAAASIPLATFVVVGDGPLRSLLPSAPANVTWRPAVDPAVMPLYYQAADCVLLPSHGEGLPLVVQEALAAGLPCVISADEAFAGALLAAGACVGVARTGPAIAGAVGELLGGGTAPLRGRARAYAEEFWDVESMVERHLALLTRICASSRRAVVANAPGGERAG